MTTVVDSAAAALALAVAVQCAVAAVASLQCESREEHPDFTVSPLKGVIPPDGSTDIVITFKPSRHRTSRTELQFAIVGR